MTMTTSKYSGSYFASPTEGNWRLRFRRRRYVGRYIGMYIGIWRQFKSDCRQTSAFVPLATGDEVIKFL